MALFFFASQERVKQTEFIAAIRLVALIRVAMQQRGQQEAKKKKKDAAK